MALRDAKPRSPATAQELDTPLCLQTAHWLLQPPLAGALALAALRNLNAQSISVFVVAVRNDQVALWPKRAFEYAAEEASLRRLEQQSFMRRAAFFRAFLAKMVRRSRFGRPSSLRWT